MEECTEEIELTCNQVLLFLGSIYQVAQIFQAQVGGIDSLPAHTPEAALGIAVHIIITVQVDARMEWRILHLVPCPIVSLVDGISEHTDL